MEKQCMDFMFWVCLILFFPADIILFVSVKTVQEWKKYIIKEFYLKGGM